MDVLTFYDPFILKTTEEDFAAALDEVDSSLDQGLFQEICDSGAIDSLYVLEWTRTVKELWREAERIGTTTSLGIVHDPCRDSRLRSLTLSAARFDYFSFVLAVRPFPGPLEAVLRRWVLLPEAPPESVWARTYKLETVKLPTEQWQRIAGVLASLPQGSAALGFGNEGTVLAVFMKAT